MVFSVRLISDHRMLLIRLFKLCKSAEKIHFDLTKVSHPHLRFQTECAPFSNRIRFNYSNSFNTLLTLTTQKYIISLFVYLLQDGLSYPADSSIKLYNLVIIPYNPDKHRTMRDSFGTIFSTVDLCNDFRPEPLFLQVVLGMVSCDPRMSS